MACAAIASGAEAITVKTTTASFSQAAFTPGTHTHTHTTHVVKHPNQFVLKTCFSQPYWVVLEIYDAPSAAKKEKSLAPGEPICPA